MTDEEIAERKRAIVQRIQAGETQIKIAADLGITRQAVSRTWKIYQKEGDSYLKVIYRGRAKETDTLNAREKQSLIHLLRNESPKAIGIKQSRWTLKSAKRAAFVRLGKRVSTAIIHQLYHQALPANYIDSPPDELAEPAPLSKGNEATVSDLDGDFPSIEEMARMNREAREPADALLPLTQPERGPGVRTGKHAKGKKSPRKKPKRRKR